MADRIDRLFADFENTESPARADNILQMTGPPGEPRSLYRGCYRRGTTDIGDDLLPNLLTVLNQAAVEQVRHLAVHSSVVSFRDRVVAFPATSGGGKTTLAAAAVLSGYGYLSDEALIFDDDGRVVPYPKPMALSPWSCEKLGLGTTEGERLFTAADLGGKARSDRGRLTDLVISTYGARSTTLQRIPSSRAVAELIEKSFNHYKSPERAFRLATQVAREVNVWKLDYGDPRQALEVLTNTLDAETA